MSTVASTAASAAAKPTSAPQLVRMASGEYTADSVAKDPTAAAKLGLSREKDGNYGTQPASEVPASPAAKSTSAVQVALTNLTLGGS